MTVDPAIKAEAQRILAKANEMQAWFLTKPPEVAAVMGLRAGLRVLPFILAGTPDGQFEKKERHRVVMAFRFLALARLCATSHALAFYDTCTALNTVNHRTGTIASASISEASGAAVTLSLAWSRNAEASAHSAAQSLRLASFIFHGTDRDILWRDVPWREAAVDRAWIDAGGSVLELQRKRLWLDQDLPSNLPEPNLTAWHALSRILEDDDPSWRVWISWYEDRLAGNVPDSDEIELFRITFIPDAQAKVRDSSKEGERRWKDELEAKYGILRNDTRKSNRLIEKFITDWHADPRNAPSSAESPFLAHANARGRWRSGWLRKLLKANDK